MIVREPPFLVLFCDGCPRGEFKLPESEKPSDARLRAEASKKGWTERKTGKGEPDDLCPACSLPAHHRADQQARHA